MGNHTCISLYSGVYVKGDRKCHQQMYRKPLKARTIFVKNFTCLSQWNFVESVQYYKRYFWTLFFRKLPFYFFYHILNLMKQFIAARFYPQTNFSFGFCTVFRIPRTFASRLRTFLTPASTPTPKESSVSPCMEIVLTSSVSLFQ